MAGLNRDTLIAILLLLACGVLLMASFDIREPDYGQLSPATWPRIIIGLLALLSFIYLIQSIRQGNNLEDQNSTAEQPKNFSITGFFSYWQNVFWCFALFLAYLISLPYLGMLIGGILFVWLLLNALGGWHPKLLLTHALIALIAVGGMWSLFTFGLGVILPPGELLGRF